MSAVLDVNDETPTFSPAMYNVSVSEDVPREFRVVWLNCTDNDVGLNAELSYFITGAASSAWGPAPPSQMWDQPWGQERGRGLVLSTAAHLRICSFSQGPAAGSLWSGPRGNLLNLSRVDAGEGGLTGVPTPPHVRVMKQ